MKSHKRRLSWFQSIRWLRLFELIMLGIFWCLTRRPVKRFAYLFSAICIGVTLSHYIPGQVQSAVASIEDEIKSRERTRLEQKRYREEVKLLYENRMIEIENKKVEAEEYIKRKKAFERQQKIEEMLDWNQVGNYIFITWCRDLCNGPDMPEGNSHVGQIQRIDGFNIYGTWGDYVLDYESADTWHTIGLQDLYDQRKIEKKQAAKKNKVKKEFVSWGVIGNGQNK